MLSGNYELREKLNTVSGYMQKYNNKKKTKKNNRPRNQHCLSWRNDSQTSMYKEHLGILGLIRFFKEFYVRQVRRRLLQARFVI